jgi:hypothetical protein
MLIKGAVPAVKTGTLFISNTIKKIPVVQEQKTAAKAKKK